MRLRSSGAFLTRTEVERSDATYDRRLRILPAPCSSWRLLEVVRQKQPLAWIRHSSLRSRQSSFVRPSSGSWADDLSDVSHAVGCQQQELQACRWLLHSELHRDCAGWRLDASICFLTTKENGPSIEGAASVFQSGRAPRQELSIGRRSCWDLHPSGEPLRYHQLQGRLVGHVDAPIVESLVRASRAWHARTPGLPWLGARSRGGESTVRVDRRDS